MHDPGRAGVFVCREVLSMGEEPRRPSRLQVTALLLVAALPVAWLIGRRSVPDPRPAPFLGRVDAGLITLKETPGGIAGSGANLPLPELDPAQEFYRLRFLPGGAGANGTVPYRMRLEGPDGHTIWQSVWDVGGDPRTPLELILPSRGLTPGRHLLRIEDARGVVRSYPFIVP